MVSGVRQVVLAQRIGRVGSARAFRRKATCESNTSHSNENADHASSNHVLENDATHVTAGTAMQTQRQAEPPSRTP